MIYEFALNNNVPHKRTSCATHINTNKFNYFIKVSKLCAPLYVIICSSYKKNLNLYTYNIILHLYNFPRICYFFFLFFTNYSPTRVYKHPYYNTIEFKCLTFYLTNIFDQEFYFFSETMEQRSAL